MAEGAVKYLYRVDYTSGTGSTYVDFSSQTRIRGVPLAAARITTNNVASLISFDIQGLDTGNVQVTYTPDVPGNTLATTHDAAVRNRTLVFVEITKIIFAGESPSPSTDAPLWEFSGFFFERIGVPMPHGDEKAHDAELSVQTAQINFGSGLADL